MQNNFKQGGKADAQRPLYIIGAGNQSKVLLSMIQECGKECAGAVDDDEKLFGNTLWGVPVGSRISDMPDKEETEAFLCDRRQQYKRGGIRGGSETLVGLSWFIRKPVYILQWKWGKDRPFSRERSFMQNPS